MKLILLFLSLIGLFNRHPSSSFKCDWKGSQKIYALIKNRSTGITDSVSIYYYAYAPMPHSPYPHPIDTLFMNEGDSLKISVNGFGQVEPLYGAYIGGGELIDSSRNDNYDGGFCPTYHEHKVFNFITAPKTIKIYSFDTTMIIPVVQRSTSGIHVILNSESIVVNNKVIATNALGKDDNIKAVSIYDLSGRTCKINSTLNNDTNFAIDASLYDNNIYILRITTDKNSFSYKFVSN